MKVELAKSRFLASAENFKRMSELAPLVVEAADMISTTLRDGGKALFCGNGGSAADAQHLAAELLGRFLLEREPLTAIALGTNASVMTAIGNDYHYEEIFSRQVRGLGRQGDVLVAISTSGNSANVLKALEAASKIGLKTIGLTGSSGGRMATACDLCINVPSDSTPRIQELHIAVGHIICELVEADLA